MHKNKSVTIFLAYVISCSSLFSGENNFINKLDYQLLNKMTDSALKKIKDNELFYNEKTNITQVGAQNQIGAMPPSGIAIMLNLYRNFRMPEINYSKNDRVQSSDTLIIGAPGNDTVTISGVWQHSGPIIVALNGLLKFKNAKATIFGDLYMLGNGRIEIDSSYMYFPQEYFYQRAIMAINTGSLSVKNSTFDYSNLSHSFMAADSAKIEITNMTNKGFTTSGYYSHSSLELNGTNEAGEVILTANCSMHYKNANTILLWHQLKAGAKMDITFPKGDTVAFYQCNNTVPGISGIDYKVTVENSTDIMWALMPSDSSEAIIKDSRIRAIGMWFEGPHASDLNGLVNNSHYDDFKRPATDRKLELINTDVMTWSLYPMHRSSLNVTGSIVGEIGGGGTSKTEASKYFCDGTGGYLWAGDTSFVISGFSSATTSVRAQNNGIFIFGYSALTLGTATAIQNGILMCLQSSLPEDPVPFDGGCVWMANMAGPSTGRTESTVNITGSVWIDKTPTSYLMNFKAYSMFYRKSDEIAWTPIIEKVASKKRNDTLARWNTKGLAPYSYVLRLMLYSDSGDSIEAIKNINLLPLILNVNDAENEDFFEIRPNPVSAEGRIILKSCTNDFYSIVLYDIFGREVLKIFEGINTNGEIDFQTNNLIPGVYYCKLTAGGKEFVKKVVVIN